MLTLDAFCHGFLDVLHQLGCAHLGLENSCDPNFQCWHMADGYFSHQTSGGGRGGGGCGGGGNFQV